MDRVLGHQRYVRLRHLTSDRVLCGYGHSGNLCEYFLGKQPSSEFAILVWKILWWVDGEPHQLDRSSSSRSRVRHSIKYCAGLGRDEVSYRRLYRKIVMFTRCCNLGAPLYPT